MGHSEDTKKKISKALTTKIKKVCLVCGKGFFVVLSRKDKAKYCSLKCYWSPLVKHHAPKNGFKKGESRFPEYQFKKGQPSWSKNKKLFHLREENACHWKGELVTKTCLVCSKTFKVKLCNKNITKFCSHKCRHMFLKGKSFSPNTQFKKGFTSWSKGKKFPERSGKNSPVWKGGITPENHRIRTSIEFRLWREAVFARDNWTCQKYGVKGGKIHPHHIKNFAQYPKLRFAIDNGVTLSEKAQREFHKKYGVKNNTKKQIKEFIE